MGIYGVLAYSVARRTSEIGIRMAMGAERQQVLGMVLADGLRMILGGVLVGLIASFWLLRLLRRELFEASPLDPVVFLGAAALLSGVALVACLLPARRATRINPMEALRYE
ncbi:MAG: FtsX-like permease family protein [Verrucomicrobia bacterium]|nr:FtsX-like permease family protein [Verrucomicrobiota bacterium]